jgi:hypothetical protein
MNTEQDISPLVNTNELPTKNPESRATLRDTFAAAALQGLVASNFYDRYKPFWKLADVEEAIPHVTAQIAYEYADAMLDYRGRSNT